MTREQMTRSLEVAELADELRELTRFYLGEQSCEIFMVVKYDEAYRPYPWVVEVGRRDVGKTGLAAGCPEAVTDILRVMLESGEVRQRLFREVESE